MKDHPKNLEPHKASPEEIAECISAKLGVEIDLNYYSELIAQVEEAFNDYWRFREVRGVKFDVFRGIEALDNAIRALEEVRLLYIALPGLDLAELIEIYEEYIVSGEDKELPLDDSKEQKTRRTKINSVTKDLGKVKKNLLGVVKSKIPTARMALKYPDGWLAWRLFIALRSAFSGHAFPNTQIDGTIYLLSRLYGIQEEESGNPAAMMRERRRRFFEKIEPHLSQPE